MRRKKNKHRLFKFLVAVILLMAIGLLFFKNLNNEARTLNSGKDTPVDKVVKREVVKKINNAAEGTQDQEKKEYLTKVADFINKQPMSRIMELVNNEQQASQALQSEVGVPKNIADEKVHEIFTSPEYSMIREKISNGDYYGAYNEYKKISQQSK
ncbi:hypothetical protein [Enterococcus sp. DIV0086]|uniref:hypothetical protein n=1 Tax=Enterococcus sp. DIV0086 TaxID=2774655 RepID=UPI003D2C3613